MGLEFSVSGILRVNSWAKKANINITVNNKFKLHSNMSSQLLKNNSKKQINSSSQYKYCQSAFKEKYTFDKRQEQSYSIMSRYLDKLPIIIEKLKNIMSPVTDISKNKFLMPDDLVVSQLMCIIRKYIELSSADSIYLFANDTLISPSESLYNTYNKYKDDDGFLYIFYTTENTFGA